MARKTPGEPQRLTKMLGTRVTDDEFRRFKRMAAEQERTEADLLRRQIRRLLQEMNP